jgi:succinoglycan biosynthesis transport protein ExoP
MQEESYEIDLKDLIFLVLRKWYIVAIGVILAATVAGLVSMFYITPVYQAKTSLFLGKEKDSLGSLDLGMLQVNNQLVVDYQELIRSRLITEDVINMFQLDMTLDDFEKRVDVLTVKDSRVFTIQFRSSDPQLASDVVNRLATVLIDKASTIIDVKNIQVIDTAIPPKEPISPSVPKNTLIAAMLGLMASLGLIVLLEMLDNTYKKAEDVEKKLSLHLLGIIPKFEGSIRTEKHIRKHARKNGNKAPNDVKTQEDNEKTLVSLHEPKSAAAEAYRTLRTNLHYGSVDRQVKTLLFTSTSMAEGKSTTCANLAISMAQSDKKVLLMDADLRKPKLHRYFNLSNGKGLIDLLAGDMDLEEVLQFREDIPNLTVLTCGSIPPNPSEILGSRKMMELLDAFREKFDYVIIDSPPVTQVTDAVVLSQIVDSTVMVISAGETNVDMSRSAVKSLQGVNANLQGFVLAKVDLRGLGNYYKYYYYEYQNK